MTKRFQAPLRFSPRPSDPACSGAIAVPLGYTISSLAMRQPRFDGRQLIAPEIDLSAYTCRAVIDWVWLEFETARVTTSRALHEHLKTRLLGGKSNVTGPDTPHNFKKFWNHVGTRFRMKIQDPDPWKVFHLEAAVRGYRGLIGPIRVIGIEVALDWYARSGTNEDRWAMVGTLHRHHLPLIGGLATPRADLHYTYTMPKVAPEKPGSATEFVIHDRRWIVAGKEDRGRLVSDLALADPKARERVLRVEGHCAPFIDSVVYRGPDTGPVMFRIQNKVSDERYPEMGTVTSLSAKDSRARVEVTLLHGAVAAAGLTGLRDLIGHNFTGLRRTHFPFWLATAPGEIRKDGRAPSPRDLRLAASLQTVFAESGVYGAKLYEEAARLGQEELRRERKALEGKAMRKRRAHHGEARHLVAWQKMNRRAVNAFDRLGDRWSPEPIERRLAMFAPRVAA